MLVWSTEREGMTQRGVCVLMAFTAYLCVCLHVCWYTCVRHSCGREKKNVNCSQWSAGDRKQYTVKLISFTHPDVYLSEKGTHSVSERENQRTEGGIDRLGEKERKRE